jgi:hypothetical protein
MKAFQIAKHFTGLFIGLDDAVLLVNDQNAAWHLIENDVQMGLLELVADRPGSAPGAPNEHGRENLAQRRG